MSENIDNTYTSENNNSDTLTKHEQRIINKEYGLCSDCNQPKTRYDWCRHCNSERFRQNFDKWTSGNENVDKFIQETQLKARDGSEVLEWIPYDRLRNIQYLAQGGFSTIYKTILLDGNIKMWNNENQYWERQRYKLIEEDYKNAGTKGVVSPLKENEEYGKWAVLKSLSNSSNIHEDFLNEWKNYLQFSNSTEGELRMHIYGITQDPETSNYMIILEHMLGGSLRSNLMEKKYNPDDKYINLYDAARSLSDLHKCNLVHGDFHSGNLLFYNIYGCFISDFGLCRPANEPINHNETYGVLPYMAPEVLRNKPYTKAADIYSFGIIMWEFTSGIPAFNGMPHDFDLSLEICRGERPNIGEGIDPDYVSLMKRCWDADPNKRPTSEELKNILRVLLDRYPVTSEGYENRIQVPENEPVIKNHPLTCYTSRKIDNSAKLNKTLNHEDLSSKIIVKEESKIIVNEDELSSNIVVYDDYNEIEELEY